MENNNQITVKRITTNKGWYEINNTRYYFKSLWEKRYAQFLQILKEQGDIKEWEYEPDTFWFEAIKRGVRSYTPDFKVFHKNGNIEYVEVKGFYDAKSLTKIKRMRIYHPQIRLRLVDKDWFKKNGRNLKMIIKDWN